MDRLCTPWRYDYVSGHTRDEGCVFCRRGADGDAGPFVLWQGPLWYVILNLYPYNNGHLLLVLNRHQAALADLAPDELAEMGRLLAAMERTLRRAYDPHGINGGYNAGASAGAGVPEHFHVHVLPRWAGDTSFMTTIGRTRVMPETLPQTFARLQPLLVEEIARLAE